MAKSPRIVEDGPYRTAPIAATLSIVALGAVALWLLPLAFELPDFDGPSPAAAAKPLPEAAPAPEVTMTPEQFDDEDRAELGIDSPLLADLRQQERTMVEARRIMPSNSFLRTVFEDDLASVRKQIEAEEQRLRTLDEQGYTPEVVCGDRPC